MIAYQFTAMPTDLLNDPQCTDAGKLLFCHMLNLSNIENWKFSVRGLVGALKKSGKWGKDKVANALRSLIDRGYIVRTETRDKNGHFERTLYRLHPRREKPDTANPATGKPDIYNTLQPKRDQNKTTTKPAGGNSFDVFKKRMWGSGVTLEEVTRIFENFKKMNPKKLNEIYLHVVKSHPIDTGCHFYEAIKQFKPNSFTQTQFKMQRESAFSKKTREYKANASDKDMGSAMDWLQMGIEREKTA